MFCFYKNIKIKSIYEFVFLGCSQQFKNNFAASKFNDSNWLHFSAVKWSLFFRRRSRRQPCKFTIVDFLSDCICCNIYKYGRPCFVHRTHNSDNLCGLIWNQWKVSALQHRLDFYFGSIKFSLKTRAFLMKSRVSCLCSTASPSTPFILRMAQQFIQKSTYYPFLFTPSLFCLQY